MIRKEQLPIIKNQQDFEFMCIDVLNLIYKVQGYAFNLNKDQWRRERASYDLIGKYSGKDSSVFPRKDIGVICESFVEKDNKQLRDSILKAVRRSPNIEELVIMICRTKDSSDIAEELKQKEYPVSVYFWDEISEILVENKKLLEKYYPNLVEGKLFSYYIQVLEKDFYGSNGVPNTAWIRLPKGYADFLENGENSIYNVTFPNGMNTEISMRSDQLCFQSKNILKGDIYKNLYAGWCDEGDYLILDIYRDKKIQISIVKNEDLERKIYYGIRKSYGVVTEGMDLMDSAIQIQSLKMNTYQGTKDWNLSLSSSCNTPCNIFIGENGSGKSSVLEAIMRIFSIYDHAGEAEEKSILKNFDYGMTYIYRNLQISLIKEKEDYTVSISKAKEGTPLIVQKNETLNKICKFVDEFSILPEKVISFYSGGNDRMAEIYHSVYKKYNSECLKIWKDFIDGKELNVQRIMNLPVKRNHHCVSDQIALYLALAMVEGSKEKDYITKYCKITELQKIQIEIEIHKKASDNMDSISNIRIENRLFKALLKMNNIISGCLDIIPDEKGKKLKISLNYKKAIETGISSYEIYSFLERLREISGGNVVAICEMKDKKLEDTQLSEGQRQWIKIIGLLALAKQSGGLLMLDEPDSHMNPRWKYDLTSVITEILEDQIGKLKKNKVLIVTHDPLLINGIEKEAVRIFYREEDRIKIKEPTEETVGMGIDGILQSQYYGMKTSYDSKTAEMFNRRLVLYTKLMMKDISDQEKAELRKLTAEIGKMDVSINSIDYVYFDFMKQYIKSPYFLKTIYSFEEMEKKQVEINKIIESLYEGK